MFLEALLLSPALSLLPLAVRAATRRDARPGPGPGLGLGPPVRTAGVSVFPIYGPQRAARLDLVRRWSHGRSLHIVECDSPEIGEVWAHNRGRSPVVLPAGVILRGGYQDRVVARDLLIHSSHAQMMQTACVEEGRWSRRFPWSARRFSIERDLAPRAICQAAETGQQHAVWEQVARFNRVFACHPPTATLIAGMRAEARQPARKKVIARLEHKLKRLPFRDRVVGFAVGQGRTVIGAHWFASRVLFRRFGDVSWSATFRDLELDRDAGERPVRFAEMREYLRRQIAETNAMRRAEGNACVSAPLHVRCQGEAPPRITEAKPPD